MAPLVARALALAAVLAAAAPATWGQASYQRIALDGPGWTVTNLNGSVGPLDVAVPVYALQALHEEGLVGDPLQRYNEVELRWTATETWVFERTFNLTAATTARQNVDLLLTGIDTVADIYLNDVFVQSVMNAFREYRIPIKELLQEQNYNDHVLRIEFHPAATAAAQRAAAYPYTVPGLTQPGGLPYYNFLRKPASDFGWDWGPAFTPAGIYGNVTIEAYDAAVLTAANVRQQHAANGSITLFFDAVLHAAAAGEQGRLTVTAPGFPRWSNATDVALAFAGENVVTVEVTISPPYDLWWPAGYGAQPLYQFGVTYAPRRAGVPTTLLRSVGFRSIELVREPRAETFTKTITWESFFFRVNGIPIFIKGANAVPVNIFHSKSTVEAVQELVQSAADANMNMIRVWGGGLYQRDEFYDACDRAGLMVWQEAMFACSLYPGDKAFLDEVRAELTYQARRISYHPSIAIWGGNNEVEASFNWFPESQADRQFYTADYTALFINTVHDVISTVAPELPFVDSSPSDGVQSTDPYVKRWGADAANPAMGDGHYYNYGGDCLDTRVYPRSKFVSEFGTQSFPSFPVFANATAPQDWSYSSSMSNYRQRHDNGNMQLAAQIARHFKLPDANDTNGGEHQDISFEHWIYLGQVTQSRCYQTAASYWRRIKTANDAQTMGVLYWQLNDIWQAPSWSSVNYGGQWKLLHYSARRFFAPLLVSAEYDTANAVAYVYATSDIPSPISGLVLTDTGLANSQAAEVVPSSWPALVDWIGNVTVSLVAWNATYAPTSAGRVAFSLPALGSAQVWTQDLRELLRSNGIGPSGLADYFLNIEVTSGGAGAGTETVAAMSIENGPQAAPTPPPQQYENNWQVFPVELKDAAVSAEPNVSWSDFRAVTDNRVAFTLRSERPAPFVALESSLPGRFSDNNMMVLPWAPQALEFISRGPVHAADVEASLKVISLGDTLPGPRVGDENAPPMTSFSPESAGFLEGLFVPGHPSVDPLALTKDTGIIPRVSTCEAPKANPCA